MVTINASRGEAAASHLRRVQELHSILSFYG
jgi:hypothetical protein